MQERSSTEQSALSNSAISPPSFFSTTLSFLLEVVSLSTPTEVANITSTSHHKANANIGQETITYALQGSIDHEDFTGSSGTIGPGDLQFMTAGRGIMHAEMPRPSPDGSPVIGVQLWVDLPKELKFTAPRYRDLRAASIPTLDLDDKKVHIKVISGKSHGVDSVKELAYTPVWILDVEIRPGGKVDQELPVGWTAFAYVLSGNSSFGPGEKAKSFSQFHNVIFEQEGDLISASVPETADGNGRFRASHNPFTVYLEFHIRELVFDFLLITSCSSCCRSSVGPEDCSIWIICSKFVGRRSTSTSGFCEF